MLVAAAIILTAGVTQVAMTNDKCQIHYIDFVATSQLTIQGCSATSNIKRCYNVAATLFGTISPTFAQSCPLNVVTNKLSATFQQCFENVVC